MVVSEVHQSHILHSRIKIPYHHNLVIAPTCKPPPRMCPPNRQDGTCMHTQRAQRLWWSVGDFRCMIKNRFRAPNTNFGI